MALTLHGTVANNTAVLDRPNAKPLIINGDMQVAQRGTSFTGQTGSAYLLDRIYMRLSDVGTYTITQDSDVPEGYGFSKSMKIDCTTANDSLEAADFMFVNMRFEKQDMRIFNKGTSSAKKTTCAAWVKSPKTGTHVVGLYDAQNNRYNMQTYTISSANTWTKAIVTFPADTAGDEMAVDNTHGMNLQFWFAAGSNFTSGSAATAWESYTAANQAVGQVDCSDSTDNNILITGIQMEVGDFDANSIAPFQHESFGDSLQRCQRYLYDPLRGSGSYGVFALGACLSTTACRAVLSAPAEMRTRPTIVTSGAIEIAGDNFHPAVTSSAVSVRTGTQAMEIQFNDSGAGLTSGEPAMIRRDNNDTAQFRLDAEL